MAESQKISLPGRILIRLIGLFFVVIGIFPLLATFGIGPIPQDEINGPPWLVFTFGGMFITAGLSVVVGQSAPLVNAVLVILTFAALVAIGCWTLFS